MTNRTIQQSNKHIQIFFDFHQKTSATPKTVQTIGQAYRTSKNGYKYHTHNNNWIVFTHSLSSVCTQGKEYYDRYVKK